MSKMSYKRILVIIFIISSCSPACGIGVPPQPHADEKPTNNEEKSKINAPGDIAKVSLDLGKDVKADTNTGNIVHINNSSNDASHLPSEKTHKTDSKNIVLKEDPNNIDSGALTRGILVFVGMGMLFLIYVSIKTWRRNKSDKSRTIIRKYGVRTTRSDLEMEPLPLSDDEEDETVFDLSASRTNLL